MMMNIFKIADFVTLNQGITPDEGQVIKDRIIESFKKGDSVMLDFSNIELLTTAFLNVIVGTLYENHTSEYLQRNLKIENLSSSNLQRMRLVIDNAKEFYKDPDKFNQNVDSAIYGKN